MPEDSVPNFMSNSGGSKVHLETLGSFLDGAQKRTYLGLIFPGTLIRGVSGAIVEKVFL